MAAVEGGILPPGPEVLKRKCLAKSRVISAGQDARFVTFAYFRENDMKTA